MSNRRQPPRTAGQPTSASCASLRVATNDGLTEGRQVHMKKKLLFTVLLAIAGYLGYRRVQADKAEQDLWAEATDPVKPRDLR